jgi:hypothetical protein
MVSTPPSYGCLWTILKEKIKFVLLHREIISQLSVESERSI